MRTLEETLRLLRERFANGWSRELVAPGSMSLTVSLSPPDARTIVTRRDDVDRWADDWYDWADRAEGVTLTEITRPKTAFGPVTVPARLDFATVGALAAIDDGDRATWAIAGARWTELGALGFRPQHRIASILALAEPDFRLAVAAAVFFRENPRSGLLPRAVPIEGMHTKWLARNRGRVLALLGSDDTADITEDDLDQRDLDALGLVVPPAQADLILCDPADRARVGGVRHLRAPVDELAALPVAPARVLVVENKESAFVLGDVPGLVIIHSLGNNVRPLGLLPWVLSAEVVYWGDLDRAGLTLLSRARAILPRLSSVLMDTSTFARHRHLAVPDATRADPPEDTLTPAELDALAVVAEGPHRLEQERLGHAVAVEALAAALRLQSKVSSSSSGTSTPAATSSSVTRSTMSAAGSPSS
ncbi:hypothetical protein KNO15_18430 [Leifsonia shinshuensis]|uniref:Wadjet anti-phage system protein JetD domain-containing protein n=1 Tax=Leifsonia shinshuensis TaxID=150026 RepID=UPI001F50B2D5|nr:Wadjet anti-phage system protein JetD domain-containing protein [Leifsonia shinshuensis]MCI0158683.1 hypothetical protein [Leifsonia shinshuensis]